MLKKFRVYLKDGSNIELELSRFTFDANSFTIYDANNYPASDTFLNFDGIAAIVPDQASDDATGFTIYLKDNVSFKVAADAFRMDQPPSLKFYFRPEKLIPNIYVCLTEVIAIIPSEGLTREL
jgi:hypothetical protein